MTLWVCISAVVLLIAYDIYAVEKGGYQATISWLIWNASKTRPIIPFAFGVLCGHFFFSQTC